MRGAPLATSGAPKQSRGGQLSSDGIAAFAPLARNDKQIVVCRELTKMFESIYRGTAEEIIKILESDKNNLKGEFVAVIK
ncbi:MAG: hypothetical protein A2174_02225 [Candidatus Portnoybacteria bacterium RBG_13_41_18]|uniref:Tetrapyrrole methylase domain-containing protein n=1 Tax=Candidatus Portnoybacteria bacterium RBG_13_41_18 TaxID=1801991 RepID=A0A1G2F9I3_9BACT|nr:MAG: hypothetical protein A2174_02225 [Candidatus Portnoybacteria bacterium RBG_13_41_18]